MSLTSVFFIIFIIMLIPVYYLVPKRIQWCILLIASLIFYSFCGISSLLFMLMIAVVSFLSAKKIQRYADQNKEYIKSNSASLTKDDKKRLKADMKKKTGTLLVVCTVLIISVLLFFKLLPVIRGMGAEGFGSIIVPLGLSYFSLQAIGYVTDVYRGVFTAEDSFLRYLLFISFFPQIIQGPINEWSKLSEDLFSEHRFDPDAFSYGFYRMLWGFYKKMVVADTMAPYISDLFANFRSYPSPTLILGALLCMLRLYADFSGYMDIVCGISEIMGVRLTENFKQPFFSQSLTEFWTRWHISLGAWFRSYVFYPVGKSSLTKNITAKCGKWFGSEFAERIPPTMGLIAVWVLIGMWHGLTAPFIIWGIASGTIMIISLWLEPVYDRIKNALRINDGSRVWHIFRMTRTFLLVSYLEVFSDSPNVTDGLGYIWCSVSNTWRLTDLTALTPYVEYQRLDALQELACIILGFIIMSVISIYQLHGKFRDLFSRVPMLFRAVIMTGLFYVIIIIGVQSVINNSGGFLYATF